MNEDVRKAGLELGMIIGQFEDRLISVDECAYYIDAVLNSLYNKGKLAGNAEIQKIYDELPMHRNRY